VHRHESYLLVRIFKSLTEESGSQLTDYLKCEMAEKPRHVIVDCSNLRAWPRLLVNLSHLVGEERRKLVSTNVGSILKKALIDGGLDRSLRPTEMMGEALTVLGLKKANEAKIDVSIVNPFIEATIAAISAHTQLQPIAGKSYSRPAHSKLPGEITGVIPLNCAGFQGFVVVSFSEKTAKKITSLILMDEISSVDERVKSAVAELTNIAFTTGKRKLNEMGFAVDSAIPQVVAGQEISDDLKKLSQFIVSIPFEIADGSIYVEIRVA
jgi:CheY-specific phosphatase CheX/anti-anti-sigma regulatory factor